MKHSIVLKAVAMVLASCALTVILGSSLGIAMIANAGLYGESYELWQESYYRQEAEDLAMAVAESYAARNVGNLSKEELDVVGWGNSWQTLGAWHGVSPENWCYTLKVDGIVKETTYDKKFDDISGYHIAVSPSYPKAVSSRERWSQSYDYCSLDGQTRTLYIHYATAPQYELTVWFAPGSFTEHNGISMELLKVLCQGAASALSVRLREGLTPEDAEERAVLRREYIDSVVGSLKGHLDCTYIVDENGNKKKLEKKQ